MSGTTLGMRPPVLLRPRVSAEGNAAATSVEVRLQAESLLAEFSAPIGVFAPDEGIWKVVVGAPESAFPTIDDRLMEVAGSAGLRLGKVTVWCLPGSPGVTWLVLPLSTTDVADLAAFVGFRTSPREHEGDRPAISGESIAPEERVPWGPACPDQALVPGEHT